jgi:NTE family protein
MSGGGFRATLFHIGALIRLGEIGALATLARVSSVSGGSITAGVLACRWEELRQAGFAPDALDRLVVAPLRRFCERNIDARAIAEGAISPWNSISDVLVREYDQDLFHGATLQGLPEAPRFVFNTTNLQTGRNLRISKAYMGDYRIGLIDRPDLKVATAVAASSAFPPVLSPCLVEVDPASWRKVEGADLHGDPRYTTTLYLTDGGAYDNLGLETVDEFQTVLVSDAGAPFSMQDKARTDPLGQTMRALDIATDQARGLRKRMLLALAPHRKQAVAYWGIDTRIGDYSAQGKLPCDPAVTDPLRRIRTRLDAFATNEQEWLINWGYALCDAAMRTHVSKDAAAPAQWPCPRHPLG